MIVSTRTLKKVKIFNLLALCRLTGMKFLPRARKLLVCRIFPLWNQQTISSTRGGGVLRFELDKGVPLKLQNPYPSLRVILAKKGYPFLRIFREK